MENNTQQILIDEVIEEMIKTLPETNIELDDEVINEMVKNHEEDNN